MLTMPKADQAVRFPPGFAPASLLTVDTEEGFDWEKPFTRDQHDLDHVEQIPRFQQFCEEIGVSPLYLVDWPIVQSDRAREIIGDAVRRGTAEVGVQLHPWVNPPFDEEVSTFNSFAGNLPPELEREKFTRLRDAIESAFGKAPISYRAGRYGLGPSSRAILQDNGILVDTSVRAFFDYSDQDGPNYEGFPNHPYWVSREPALLELPVTSIYRGALAASGRTLFPKLTRLPRGPGIASRTGLLERVRMTPEGTPLDAACKAVDAAMQDGLPLFVLSFHSPSLAPGNTPYTHTEKDVEELYAWLRGVYAHMGSRGIAPTTVSEVWQAASGG